MTSIETIARCVILDGDRVLLCGAVRDGHPQYWYLPGGHIEAGETARQAVAREMMEETGVDITVGDCVLVSENHFTQIKTRTAIPVRRHEYTLVFIANSPTTLIESIEPDICFAWIGLKDVALADVRPTSHRDWLAAYTDLFTRGDVPSLRFHVEQS